MHLDIGHMVVSSLVHGLVYDMIFKATRHLTAMQTAGLAVAVIAGVWLAARMFGGKRR
jgi:sugar phosphate permease